MARCRARLHSEPAEMMHVAWPWMALCLPLPWLLARWLPPVRPDGAALFVPFAATVAAQGTLSANAIPRWRLVLFVLVWLALVAAAMRTQWLGAQIGSAAWMERGGREVLR